MHIGKGLASSSDNIIKNRSTSGAVSIKPDNTSGTEINLLSADPEGQSVTASQMRTDIVVGDTSSEVNIKGTSLSGGVLSGGPSVVYAHIDTNHYIRKIRDESTIKIYHLWISKKQDTSTLTIMTAGACTAETSRYMTLHYRIMGQDQPDISSTEDGYWRGIIRKTCSNGAWSGTSSLINYVSAGGRSGTPPSITNDTSGLTMSYGIGRALFVEMHIIIVGATDQDTFYAGIF